jgi:hypothetical protein
MSGDLNSQNTNKEEIFEVSVLILRFFLDRYTNRGDMDMKT